MDEFNSMIDRLKSLIVNTPPDDLQETVYTSLGNGCRVLTAFISNSGNPGWCSKVVNDINLPIFDSKQQAALESSFKSAPWLLEFFKDRVHKQSQSGGAKTPSLIPDSFITDAEAAAAAVPLTGDDVSLDLMLQKLIAKTQTWDDYWRKMESGTFDVVKKTLDTDQIVVTPYGPVPIPRRPVVMLVIAILDALRFSRALMGQRDLPLTFLVLIEELVTGQWRQMIMTAAGLLSPSGVAMGVFFKYIINAWVLISPGIRTQLIKDVFKGGKSLVVGLILWGATVLPPEIMKTPIKMAIEKMHVMVKGLDDKVGALEAKASEALRPAGLKVKFAGMDLSNLTRITFQDIQNVQELAQWRLLICTKEYQEIQASLEKNPFFRLVMEILSIPTLSGDKYAICGTSVYKSVGDVMVDAMEPMITDLDGNPPAMPLHLPLPSLDLPAMPLPSAALPMPTMPAGLPAMPSAAMPAGLPAMPSAAMPLPSAALPKLQKGGKTRKRTTKIVKSEKVKKLTKRVKFIN